MMDTRWQRVGELFESLRGRSTVERDQALRDECGDDALLRAEVESLLDRADRTVDFLEDPISADTPRVLKSLAGIDDALVGSLLGGYSIESIVASGGMGTVYRARAVDEPGQLVAVKVVRDGGDATEVARRFRNEGELLASLDHPNIARYIDSGVTLDGRPFYVMEFIDGEPIVAACDRAGWSVERRLDLFCQVCSAVEHAHRNLVIHRDLKPGNVLVDRFGDVRLVDFGIATVLAPGRAKRGITRWMTPEYTSPEQARGELATTASDIYSLGMILYELLTGRPPYTFEVYNPAEIARVVSEVEAPRTSQVAADLDASTAAQRATTPARLRRRLGGDLDNIVGCALRKEPGRRYSTVERLLDDLRRHLAGQPVGARPDTFAYRAGKFVRRNRLTVAMASVVLFALALGVAGTLWQAGVAREEWRNSERVTELMVEVLGGAEPGSGIATTAREFVDRAAARVERLTDVNPTIRASLEHALGRMYYRLGDYERASSLLDGALRTRVEHFGEAHAHVAATQCALAVSRTREGHLDEAHGLLTRALVTARSPSGTRRVQADVLDALGHVLNCKGERSQAETVFRDAIALRREVYGANHEMVTASMNNLATVRWALGDYEEADRLLRGALEMRTGQLGEDHPGVSQILHNLGVLHLTMRDFAGSRELMERALSLRERVYPAGHPKIAETLYAMGSLSIEAGQGAPAVEHLRRCLEIREKAIPQHWHTDDTRSMLAAAHLQLGEYAQAETLLRTALDRLRAARGDKFEHTQEAFERLARVCEATGRADEALRLRAFLVQ